MSLKKKEIIEICVISICAVVLLVALVQRLSGKKKEESLQSQAPKFFADQVSDNIQKEKMGLYASLEERSGYLDVARDPFFKVAAPLDPVTRGLHLSGIMWDKDEPLVIINDQILSAGDAVEGRTIVEVKQYSVTIHDINGKTFELKLEQEVKE